METATKDMMIIQSLLEDEDRSNRQQTPKLIQVNFRVLLLAVLKPCFFYKISLSYY